MIYSLNINVICVTKTWLTSNIWNNEFHINSRGGGIFLTIDRAIPSKLLTTSQTIEAPTIELIRAFITYHSIYILFTYVDMYHNQISIGY